MSGNSTTQVSDIGDWTCPLVFISYSRSDSTIARLLGDHLLRLGADIWIDQGEMRIGDRLEANIRNGVHSADYVVVILSPNSSASKWVAFEIEEAARAQTKIVPIVIDDCELPCGLDDIVNVTMRVDSEWNDGLKQLASLFGLDGQPSPAACQELAVRLATGHAQLEALVADAEKGSIAAVNAQSFHAVNLPACVIERLTMLLAYWPNDRVRYGAGCAAIVTLEELGTGESVLQFCLRKDSLSGTLRSGLITRMCNVSSDEVAVKVHQLFVELKKDGTVTPFELDAHYHTLMDRHHATLMPQYYQEILLYLTVTPGGPVVYGLETVFLLVSEYPSTLQLMDLWRRWISDGQLNEAMLCDAHWAIATVILEQHIQHLYWVSQASEENLYRLLKSRDIDSVSAGLSHMESMCNTKYPRVREVRARMEPIRRRNQADLWPWELKQTYGAFMDMLRLVENEPHRNLVTILRGTDVLRTLREVDVFSGCRW